MKIKPGFIMRQLGGEYVVVPVGAASINFNGMLRLNETGAFLWKALSGGAGEDELVWKLLEEYEGVDEQTARTDVAEFLNIIRDVLDE